MSPVVDTASIPDTQMDFVAPSQDELYEEEDDYQILDLDQQPKLPIPESHPLAFEEFDVDENEPIDFDFINRPTEEEKTFDEDNLSDNDDLDYDDIVENYEEIENEEEEGEEVDEYRNTFVIPKRTRRRKATSKLDEDLRNVFAHARLLKAEKKYADAIKICQGIIKQAPNADEVYSFLASLYELTGNSKGAEQIKEIAELMAPCSREVVEKQLKEAEAAENHRSASYLYGKLIRMDINNLELHEKYVGTLEKLNNTKRLLMARTWMIKAMRDPSMAENAKELAVHTAYELMSLDFPNKAKICLENFVLIHPDYVDESFVNLLTEIYVKLEDYEAILLCLIIKSGVKAFDADAQEVNTVDQFEEILDCVVPDDLPVELKSKLCVALVGLGFPHLAQPLEEILLAYKSDYADAVIDVAHTHKKKENFERACQMISEILALRDQDTSELWVLLAECFEGLGQLERASSAYEAAVERNSQNMKIRQQYGLLLEKMGKIREAIDVMTPDSACKVIDTDVQYELCMLCKRNMRLPTKEDKGEFFHDFLKAVQTLFARHCYQIKSRTEFEGFFSLNRRTTSFGSLNLSVLCKRSREKEYSTPKHIVSDEYSLFEEVYEMLLNQKMYPELERLVFQAVMSTQFNRGDTWRKELGAKAFVASYLSRDPIPLFARSRALVEASVTDTAWNFFNMACNRSFDMRQTKPLMRYSARHPECIPALIMTGHNSLVAGSYKYALNEYMMALKMVPKDPMVLLSIGCVFIHLACQKASDHKSSLIAQGIAFFQAYKEVRGEGQETYYNLGRAYHQVGLLTQALHNYRLALEQKPWLPSCDLTREIAVNIVTLYKMTGARDLALHYLKKYLCF